MDRKTYPLACVALWGAPKRPIGDPGRWCSLYTHSHTLKHIHTCIFLISPPSTYVCICTYIYTHTYTYIILYSSGLSVVYYETSLEQSLECPSREEAVAEASQGALKLLPLYHTTQEITKVPCHSKKRTYLDFPPRQRIPNLKRQPKPRGGVHDVCVFVCECVIRRSRVSQPLNLRLCLLQHFFLTSPRATQTRSGCPQLFQAPPLLYFHPSPHPTGPFSSPTHFT